MKIHEMEQGLINLLFLIIYLSFPSGFKVGPDLKPRRVDPCDIGRRVVGPGLVFFSVLFLFFFNGGIHYLGYSLDLNFVWSCNFT